MMRRLLASAAILAGLGLVGPLAQAAPEVVDGPGYLPECFAPWNDEITYFQWEPREGPYKIALVNGFVGNTWRIQMIQTAKAFVEQEGIKEHISDFRVISTGTDAAAQLGAIEDFINQGFDAIVTIAVSPEGFDRVIRLADRNNVVIVPFDNILDTNAVMMVNEDQFEMGVMSANFLIEQMGGATSGKVLEVRGLPGNSVDRDRHLGFRSIMEAPGNSFEIVEIVGNWDDGTRRRRRPTCSRCTTTSTPSSPRAVDGHRARLHRRRPPDGADGGRGRERLQEADRSPQRRGSQGPLLRPVARPRRDLDQGGDRRPPGREAAAAHLGADPGRRLHQPRGRRELLVGPFRQFLHAQRVPAL